MSGPLDSGLSGGDVHALRLSDALARRDGNSVRLVTVPSMRDKVPPAAQASVIAVNTPLDGRLTSLTAYLAAVIMRTFRSWQQAPRSRVSVAETHFFFDVVPVAIRKRRHGSKAVAYAYHLVSESGRRPGVRSFVSIALERFSLGVLRRVADLVFVDNPETERGLIARGFPADVLRMTRNAYDPLEPMPPRSPGSTPTIVFCGRLVEAKGIWDVVELARALKEHGSRTRIAMLGDGPLRVAVERRVRAEALDNVMLLGFVPEAEKWRILRSAALFVSPSIEEGWGIAVGEALIAGVPAVVYDLPAYAHLGDLPVRVPVADARRFVDVTVGLVTDAARLEDERRRIDSGSSQLPRWSDVLADEIAAMERL